MFAVLTLLVPLAVVLLVGLALAARVGHVELGRVPGTSWLWRPEAGFGSRVLTAIAILLVGPGIAILIGWPLGRLAKSLEGSVDRPILRTMTSHHLSGLWTSTARVGTQTGNRPEMQVLTLVSAAVLAVWLWRTGRRWWVPLVAGPATYLMEKYGQHYLGLLVHRGHPPTTLGTWPSGGVARLIVVGGLIVFMVARYAHAERRTAVLGFTLVALLTTVEGYCRTYLLQHWFTDVLGGVVFGLPVLLAGMALVVTLDPAPDARA
ncbi:MAG: hypothetical protein M3Z50_03610 [Actinomycetota bacterium]|nr:hypothetical protein [Actinomycetota bacterium]